MKTQINSVETSIVYESDTKKNVDMSVACEVKNCLVCLTVLITLFFQAMAIFIHNYKH